MDYSRLIIIALVVALAVLAYLLVRYELWDTDQLTEEERQERADWMRW